MTTSLASQRAVLDAEDMRRCAVYGAWMEANLQVADVAPGVRPGHVDTAA